MKEYNDITFEQLGGREILMKISKCFYDKIYKDDWIGQYFKDVPQEVIESQQVDFMTASLGGPKIYLGKLPVPAHKHMMITEELFVYREELLDQALDECGASDALKYRWKKIDQAFKNSLVKNSIDDCQKRFNTDEIVFFEKPYKKAS